MELSNDICIWNFSNIRLFSSRYTRLEFNSVVTLIKKKNECYGGWRLLISSFKMWNIFEFCFRKIIYYLLVAFMLFRIVIMCKKFFWSNSLFLHAIFICLIQFLFIFFSSYIQHFTFSKLARDTWCKIQFLRFINIVITSNTYLTNVFEYKYFGD